LFLYIRLERNGIYGKKHIKRRRVVREFEREYNRFRNRQALGTGLAKALLAQQRLTARSAICARPSTRDCAVEILTFDDPDGKKAFWHTSSHVLAQAVLHLFPGAKFAIGPAIDNGFYYDFEVENPFTPEDLEKNRGRNGGHCPARGAA
jgi:threonyl-tRNA synthetase